MKLRISGFDVFKKLICSESMLLDFLVYCTQDINFEFLTHRKNKCEQYVACCMSCSGKHMYLWYVPTYCYFKTKIHDLARAIASLNSQKHCNVFKLLYIFCEQCVTFCHAINRIDKNSVNSCLMNSTFKGAKRKPTIWSISSLCAEVKSVWTQLWLFSSCTQQYRYHANGKK